MDITAEITVPDYVYRFYSNASRCIHGHTAEDVMADALSAYAEMLSGGISEGKHSVSEAEENL